MPKPLVIVESPAKAKTISKFLGKDWMVEASIGHVRDLPSSAAEIPAAVKGESWARLGVNVDAGYDPLYVVPGEKKAKIRELKAKLKDASALYLATDEDREGEAISWHLLELLQPKVPVKRMVFHEITKAAIAEAVENCRDVDQSLVDAQEARRILDRLYGYEVSPLLWRKIAPRLSAGRVQSVTTRLVVERERERMAFTSAAWWDARVTLEHEGARFPATVTSLDGKALAQGRDFGTDGKLLAGRKVQVLDEAAAGKLARGLAGQRARVERAEEKEYGASPKAPFTTSTLQQEAGRKLGMTAKRAMQAAQRLYENGYITYMRTDSVALSTQAIAAARELVGERYGKEYLPRAPRQWEGKSRNAQEAHEAIRPAGESFRDPAEVERELGGDEARVYDLVWKRTVASQMLDARLKSVTATFDVPLAGGGKAELVARGKTVLFDGFLRAYVEGTDEPDAPAGGEEEAVLPDLARGDEARVAEAQPAGHATKPPARYTEAGLVQKLEELGIGRPSTYASIIGTILDREYVVKRGTALVPTPLAFAVVNLMTELEPTLIDYSFTAGMEEALDAIARGELKRNTFLERFYKGSEPGLHAIVTGKGGEIDAKRVNTIPIGERDGKPIALRVGRYGPYIEHGDARASVPEGLAPDEITLEKAIELLATASQAEEPLGHAKDGAAVYLRTGRFGPYVQLGEDTDDKKKKPKRASLLRTMSPKTLTLEQALKLLSLPRALGDDVDGNPITAALGRFGPYLAKTIPGAEKPDYRNLKSEEQLFTVTLEEARAIYAQPKTFRRRGAGPAAPPLKELGVDPESGGQIVVKDGRYGPYCTDGTTNASLPKDSKVEDFGLTEAVRLLAERREAGPKKKPPKRASLLRSMSPKTLTLEQALKLLSLPRALSNDVDGNPIVAALGRFGPYLAKTIPGAEKPDYRNLKTEEQLFAITLEEARAIYAQPKSFRRRGAGPAAPPLRELGVDPESGGQIVIKDGRYGPYCTDGTTNASLPKDSKVEDFSLTEAVRLLAERREAGPKKPKRRKAPARKKSKAG
ncbi:MAG TPA: type I DNA topoisomerase [Planctomycetota bacterium]